MKSKKFYAKVDTEFGVCTIVIRKEKGEILKNKDNVFLKLKNEYNIDKYDVISISDKFEYNHFETDSYKIRSLIESLAVYKKVFSGEEELIIG
jgi:hypothetical protein